MEDNAACAQIIVTGKNPTLRHVLRTQKVDIAWLHEVFRDHKNLKMTLTPAKKQSADIFTKRFNSPREWLWACYNIGIDLSECLGSQDVLQSPIADSLKPKITKSMKKAATEVAAGGACAPQACVPCGAPLKVKRRTGKTNHCLFCCTTHNALYGNMGMGDHGMVSGASIHATYLKPFSSPWLILACVVTSRSLRILRIK